MIIVKDNYFHLSTDKTSYVFMINEAGLPEHIYYGKKIGRKDGSLNVTALRERIGFVPGNTVNYSPEHERLSLEAYSSEYSALGHGDIREPSIIIVHPNGSVTSDFIFESHEVLDELSEDIEKSKLPHSYDENGSYEHLKIILKDRVYEEKLELHYFVYPNEDVITKSVMLKNEGNAEIRVERLMSGCMEFPFTSFKVTSFRGRWAHEMNRCDNIITGGKMVLSSSQGSSGSRCNPFFIMSDMPVTENTGRVYGFNLVYSGDHYSALETSAYGKTRLVSGINPDSFSYILGAGEMIAAPEAVLSYSEEGYNGLSRNMHHFIRKHIVRGYWRDRERPILLNSWEAAYFDINESKLLKLAKVGKECGMELFVMDDGWFGRRDDDKSSLGDWYENKKKLPNGLKGLVEKINKMGMKFGIWVEPEMVSVDSDLYREHPEYTMEIQGQMHSEGRNQRVLNLADPKVIDYLYEKLEAVFSSANIEYVKWDMNRVFSDVYAGNLPAENQGEVSYRYMLGLYELLDRLTKAFPEILFEGCASGGNRFDLGMLCYFPQIWASDNTDAISRIDIEKGYSYGYPMNTVSSHVSGVPNHQTLRVVPIETRFNIAVLGVLGYESNLLDFSKEDIEKIKKQVALYKEWRSMLMSGDFYRTDPYEKDQGLIREGLAGFYSGNNNTDSFTIVSSDKEKAVAVIVRRMAVANDSAQKLYVNGLDDEAEYHLYNIKYDNNIKEFGDLINTVSPIHIKQNSMMQNIISKFVHLKGDEEDVVLSGSEMKNAGVSLAPSFGGTGYEDGMRLFSDYSSRLYFIEKI